MAILTISIPNTLLEAFNAKFPPEEREEVLADLLIDLVNEDPYSPEALADDERAYDEVANGGESYSTDEVLALLKANLPQSVS